MYVHLRLSFNTTDISHSGFKFAEMEMSESWLIPVHLGADHIFAEVVLATLVSHFTFELSDKHIVWNNSSITFPSVDDGSDKPALPMKVCIYKAE